VRPASFISSALIGAELTDGTAHAAKWGKHERDRKGGRGSVGTKSDRRYNGEVGGGRGEGWEVQANSGK